MEKKLLITGSIFMLMGVVLGAMAAHALENYLDADQLDSFQTGVRYQIYHGLALLLFSQVKILSDSSLKIIWWLFLIGSILFSFSIFLLTTSGITGLELRFLGPLTPVGGLLLISGWGFTIFKISSYKC